MLALYVGGSLSCRLADDVNLHLRHIDERGLPAAEALYIQVSLRNVIIDYGEHVSAAGTFGLPLWRKFL